MPFVPFLVPFLGSALTDRLYAGLFLGSEEIDRLRLGGTVRPGDFLLVDILTLV